MADPARRALSGVYDLLDALFRGPADVVAFADLCANLTNATVAFYGERSAASRVVSRILDLVSIHSEYGALPQFSRLLSQFLYNSGFLYPPERLQEICDVVSRNLEEQLVHLPVEGEGPAGGGARRAADGAASGAAAGAAGGVSLDLPAAPAFRPGIIGQGAELAVAELTPGLPPRSRLNILWVIDSCRALAAALRQALILEAGQRVVCLSPLAVDLLISRLLACSNSLRKRALGRGKPLPGVPAAPSAEDPSTDAREAAARENLSVSLPDAVLLGLTAALAESCAFLALFSPSFSDRFSGRCAQALLDRAPMFSSHFLRAACYSLVLSCRPLPAPEKHGERGSGAVPPYFLSLLLKRIVSLSCEAARGAGALLARDSAGQPMGEPVTKRGAVGFAPAVQPSVAAAGRSAHQSAPHGRGAGDSSDSVDTPTALCWAAFLFCSTCEVCGLRASVGGGQWFDSITAPTIETPARLNVFMGFPQSFSRHHLKSHAYLALLARIIRAKGSPVPTINQGMSDAVCRALVDAGGVRFLRRCKEAPDLLVRILAQQVLLRVYSFSTGLAGPVFHDAAMQKGRVTPEELGQDLVRALEDLEQLGWLEGLEGRGESLQPREQGEHDKQEEQGRQADPKQPDGTRPGAGAQEGLSSGDGREFPGTREAESFTRARGDDLFRLYALRDEARLCLCKAVHLSFYWTGESANPDRLQASGSDRAQTYQAHQDYQSQADFVRQTAARGEFPLPRVFLEEQAAHLADRLGSLALCYAPLLVSVPLLAKGPTRSLDALPVCDLDGGKGAFASAPVPVPAARACEESPRDDYIVALSASLRFRAFMIFCAALLLAVPQCGSDAAEGWGMSSSLALLGGAPSAILAHALHAESLSDRIAVGILFHFLRTSAGPTGGTAGRPAGRTMLTRRDLLSAIYAAGGITEEPRGQAADGRGRGGFSTWGTLIFPEGHSLPPLPARVPVLSLLNVFALSERVDGGQGAGPVGELVRAYFTTLSDLLAASPQAKRAAELEAARERLDDANTRIVALAEREASLLSELQACRADLEEERRETAVFAEKLRQADAEREKLSAELNDAQSAAEQSKLELSAAREAATELRDELEARDSRIEELQADLASASGQLEQALGVLSRYRAALAQIRASAALADEP